MLTKINKIKHQRSGNFFLMAGPCAIESEEMALRIAEKVIKITNHRYHFELEVQWIVPWIKIELFHE